MPALFDDPMVQAGFAPFLVALAVAAVLARWRPHAWPWLALVAGLLTTLCLTTGVSFTPWSASRKTLFLVLLAPALGLVLDLAGLRHKALVALLSVAVGASAVWVFQSLLVQAEGLQALITGGSVALMVALLVAACLVQRDDGPALAATTLGLGVAVAVSAVLSASIGTLMNGLAVAMGGAALLLLQLLRNTPLPAGWTGALSIGTTAALFAAGTLMLAEGRWPAMLLLLVVPAAVMTLSPRTMGAHRSTRVRTVVLGLAALAAALVPVAAAWWATQAPAA
jgi:hypothetical protein